ncbi:MAG: ATPase, T2SS/T4P/T4SS family [Tepidisphaeraceae bacterium]
MATPGVEAPEVDEPAVEDPVIDEPAAQAPVVEPPPPEPPAVEARAAEAPAVDAPAVETPAPAAPAAEGRIAEAPGAESPAIGSPVAEAPANEPPVVEAAAVAAPAAETAAAEAPAIPEPVAETPVVDAPAVEAPVTDAPAIETAAAETPAVETPAAGAPAAERPAAETPVVETPVVETPVAGAPVVETPVAGAPAAEAPLEAAAKTGEIPKPAESSETNDSAEPEPEPLWKPTEAKARISVEQLLLQRGVVSAEQLTQAQSVALQTPGRSIAAILLGMSAANEAQILSALAETLGLPFETPQASEVDPAVFSLLQPDYIRRRMVLPLRKEGRVVVVGMPDPTNVFLLDEIKRRTRSELRVVVVTPADVNRICEQITTDAVDVEVDKIIKDMAEDDVQVVETSKEEVTDLAKMGSESPIIRFVNYLIFDAIKQSASDIHIEPKEKELKVRYRIDGVLVEAMTPPKTMHAAVVSRLKIMANLDIAERRLPQDGRIRAVVHTRKVDLRVSTLPTAAGEKCVLRILDNRSINVPLEELGFGEDALTIWKRQIMQPHGILLVTGPTGSGKTTTLYSSLRCMDGNKLNISTVEDPIEYHLQAANQVQVHDKIGMSFAAALRSLLRQDPDVVMVGEIRDAETARIAVQAALTGHLVLSTLHTNDAPASITRLINIGVEPYLISAAVNAIMAQRLVRKVCSHCKEEFHPSDEMREFLTMQGFNAEATWRGKGCDRCRRTGYSGRLGIYELLVMDDWLRDQVTRNPDVTHLRKLCRERGLVTLRDDGFKKVVKGLTTVDEILRVTENAL